MSDFGMDMILMSLLWVLYVLCAMIHDALRFASFGFIKTKLQKKSLSGRNLDLVLQRLESYFDDNGSNLRELEWAGLAFLLGGFYHYLSGIDHVHPPVALGVIVGVAAVGGLLSRAISEPYAESVLIGLYPLWRIIHVGTKPLTFFVQGLQVLVQRVSGQEVEQEEEEQEQRLLDSMEDGSKSGVLEESEREMIENLIEFKDLEVSEVMTPRTEMAAVPEQADLDQVVKEMVEKRYSRIVVYRDNRDNVVGFVHVRDLLPYYRKDVTHPPLVDLMHSAYYVPETKSIRSLFQEFKNEHLHIAVVLDEYGGTAGLITLEDILEEIVGEIVDEHQDEDDMLYEKVSDTEVKAQGRMRVTELEEILGVEFEEDDSYDSVGGMLIAHLGKIPSQGEQGQLPEVPVQFKVLDANERRVEVVQFSLVMGEEEP